MILGTIKTCLDDIKCSPVQLWEETFTCVFPVCMINFVFATKLSKFNERMIGHAVTVVIHYD